MNSPNRDRVALFTIAWVLLGALSLLFIDRGENGWSTQSLAAIIALSSILAFLGALTGAHDSAVPWITGPVAAAPPLIWCFFCWKFRTPAPMHGIAGGVLLVVGFVATYLGRRWAALRSEPAGFRYCPHCKYDLYGLSHSGRCPECGEAFQLNRAAARREERNP